MKERPTVQWVIFFYTVSIPAALREAVEFLDHFVQVHLALGLDPVTRPALVQPVVSRGGVVSQVGWGVGRGVVIVVFTFMQNTMMNMIYENFLCFFFYYLLSFYKSA